MYLTRLGNLEFDNQGYLVDGQGQVVYGYLSVENPLYTKALESTKADPADDPDITKLPMIPSADDANNNTVDATKFYRDKDGQVVKPVLKAGADPTSTNPSDYNFVVVDQYTPSPVLTAIRAPMAYAADDPAKGIKKGDAAYPTWDLKQGSSTYGQIVDAEEGVSGRINRDSISIDENTGRITCTTATGQAVVIGSIAIAKVENPNGVTHVDGHYYQALDGAGDIWLTSVGYSVPNSNDADSPFNGTVPTQADGTPVQNWDATGTLPGEIPIQSSGGTKLISGGLESSGTDLASEISNMIMIQRGYQANTRIVTVTDSMLEELVNMKR